jgi:hypothetical protein
LAGCGTPHGRAHPKARTKSSILLEVVRIMIIEHVTFSHLDPLQPEELEMLHRVFDVTCAAAGIRKKSPQAEGLAATLFELFRSGIRDEDQLKAAVSKIDFI